MLAMAAVLHWWVPDAGAKLLSSYQRLPVVWQALVVLVLVYVLMALSIGTAPFVYFQF